MPLERGERRVVWITGAAGGLGREMVEQFLESGDRVVAGFFRGHAFAESDHLWPLRADVTRKGEVTETVKKILERWRHIDVLIQCAGITADHALPRMSEADWQLALEVNLKGAFHCAQAVIPGMLRRRKGHLIQISSFSARQGHEGQCNYAAAKAGVIGLTQSIAKEVASRNIQSNVILPGLLRTPMTDALSDTRRQALIASTLLHRWSDPKEVARFAHCLSMLTQVSGQVFQLDSRISPWT